MLPVEKCVVRRRQSQCATVERGPFLDTGAESGDLFFGSGHRADEQSTEVREGLILRARDRATQLLHVPLYTGVHRLVLASLG